SAALDSGEADEIQEAETLLSEVILREKSNRDAAKDLIGKADASVETNDKDYVFIHFILNYLPTGLIGLLLAVILSAAMSSTASELNALGTITAMDLYKRNKKGEFTDKHFVIVSKGFTLLWGIIAIIIACVANLFDNLIQLVNIIGSIFYGNVLGIFLLAFFFRFVKGNSVFIAAIITQIIVIIGYSLDWMSYLWLNAFGCGLVILLALILEVFDRLHNGPPIEA
ncbi:MAG: sodium:solute symporter, partial [Eudoraea sp.]|nr:sodium:solute symporter [Eudoraea sp.]